MRARLLSLHIVVLAPKIITTLANNDQPAHSHTISVPEIISLNSMLIERCSVRARGAFDLNSSNDAADTTGEKCALLRHKSHLKATANSGTICLARCEEIFRHTTQRIDLVARLASHLHLTRVASHFKFLLRLFVCCCRRDLKCIRNTIHTNLMLTYVLTDLTWIITARLQLTNHEVRHPLTSCLLIYQSTAVLVLHDDRVDILYWHQLFLDVRRRPLLVHFGRQNLFDRTR